MGIFNLELHSVLYFLMKVKLILTRYLVYLESIIGKKIINLTLFVSSINVGANF